MGGGGADRGAGGREAPGIVVLRGRDLQGEGEGCGRRQRGGGGRLERWGQKQLPSVEQLAAICRGTLEDPS